jgi:hypothetical protein
MRVILAVAMTVAIATPAAAQYGSMYGGTYVPRDYSNAQEYRGSPNHARGYRGYARAYRGSSSYAQEYSGSPHSTNPEYDVYVNGEYVGSDPDPRIRASLAQEWRSQSGNR